MRESGRAVQIANTIVETARQCNLDRDIDLPDKDAADLSVDERDSIVGGCYSKLMEIESRLLPCGLHVVGCPPSAEEATATLVNIAEIDRPDASPPLTGLPSMLAASIGRDMEDIYTGNNKGDLKVRFLLPLSHHDLQLPKSALHTSPTWRTVQCCCSRCTKATNMLAHCTLARH